MKPSLELSSSVPSTAPKPSLTPGPHCSGNTHHPLGGHRAALTPSHCREQMAVYVHVPTLPAVSLPACCPPLAQEPALHPLMPSGTTMAQCHRGTKPLENSSAQSKRTHQEKPPCAQQQQEPTTDVPLWEHLALHSISTDMA